MKGFVKNLQRMKVARAEHGCTQVSDEFNNKVFNFLITQCVKIVCP